MLTRRSQLLADLASGLAEPKSPDLYRATDSPDMAAMSTDKDMVFQIVEMESEELEQIEDALERIESGDYGTCEACGKPIGWGRLNALASASLCIKCKVAAEAGGLGVLHAEECDWERVDAYERTQNAPMEMALDRGEKIT